MLFHAENGLVLVTGMVCTQRECWATWGGCQHIGDGADGHTLGSLSPLRAHRIHTAPGDANAGPASSLSLSFTNIPLEIVCPEVQMCL